MGMLASFNCLLKQDSILGLLGISFAFHITCFVFCGICNTWIFDWELQDELEITSRVLGQRGGYSGTIVLLRNKATGEVIAEGRHSLFRQHASKI